MATKQDPELKRLNQQRLREMKAVKVQNIMLLGADLMHATCKPSRDCAGKKLPIHEATTLPLPNCTAEECLCTWIATQ